MFKRLFKKSPEYQFPRPEGVKAWTAKKTQLRFPKNVFTLDAGVEGLVLHKHKNGKDVMFQVAYPDGLALAGWVDKKDLTFTAPVVP